MIGFVVLSRFSFVYAVKSHDLLCCVVFVVMRHVVLRRCLLFFFSRLLSSSRASVRVFT